MNKEFFVEKVKSLCSRKGIKPTNACKESGVGGSFLSDINRGQVPSVAKVQMLADYLGVTTSELLGEKEKPATREGDELDEQTARLMDKLRQMAPEDQELLEAQIDVMLRRRQEK